MFSKSDPMSVRTIARILAENPPPTDTLYPILSITLIESVKEEAVLESRLFITQELLEATSNSDPVVVALPSMDDLWLEVQNGRELQGPGNGPWDKESLQRLRNQIRRRIQARTVIEIL